MKKFEGNRYPLVLMRTEVGALGVQAPGAVVLRDLGPQQGHRLVVHFYNAQDGGHHSGYYYDDYEKAVAKFEERSREMTNHHERIPMIIFTEEIPEYGDLMTLEEFLHDVKDGCITDYDGTGHWSNGFSMSREGNVFGKTPEGATHVVWFNK